MSNQHPFEMTGSPFDTQPDEEKLNGPEKKARGRPKKTVGAAVPVLPTGEQPEQPARVRRGGRPKKTEEKEEIDFVAIADAVSAFIKLSGDEKLAFTMITNKL